MVRIDKKLFEATCKEICSEEWYKKENFLHIKRDKIKTHFLRPPLRGIAAKYFPNINIGSKVAFPVDIVVRIAHKMDLFVTDIIRF